MNLGWKHHLSIPLYVFALRELIRGIYGHTAFLTINPQFGVGNKERVGLGGFE